MVSQLLRVSPVKPDFNYIKDVYEVCLEKYLQNPQKVFDVINSINHGRKILISNEEVDTYIAFYGIQHYYKLIEAIDALDISKFEDKQLEIFSYGCGAATDTCSLISYCRSKQINLPFKKLTLIEPSLIALKRGIEYINQALCPEELKKIRIKPVNKYLENLGKSDVSSECTTSKIHIFSNILDLQSIDLNDLASLILTTQTGNNYFMCISPIRYDGRTRIKTFYQIVSNSVMVNNICTKDTGIRNKVWSMKKNDYDNNYYIDRYHKIFMTQMI